MKSNSSKLGNTRRFQRRIRGYSLTWIRSGDKNKSNKLGRIIGRGETPWTGANTIELDEAKHEEWRLRYQRNNTSESRLWHWAEKFGEVLWVQPPTHYGYTGSVMFANPLSVELALIKSSEGHSSSYMDGPWVRVERFIGWVHV